MSEQQPTNTQFPVSSFKFRILIAEDDFTSRTMLSAVLRKCGYEVVAACNGLEACRILEQPGAPRLAIIDWIMPELDGVAVCQRIRTIHTYHPPYIIMLTSRNEQQDIVHGLRAGADDYLVKPYDAAELQARVEVGYRMISLQERLSEKVQELQQALNRVKTLEGIIPICSLCKKIRDDRYYWQQVEAFVSTHTEVRFAHSLCPDCIEKLYSNLTKAE